ncbi:MAG: hypothetical protein ACLRSW_08115 [Christensenellaceae bacterium]
MKQTKIWLKLVACAIAVSMCFACFAFVGCKGGSTPNDDWGEDDPPTPTEPVTIRVMHYWPECAEAFDEIAENFTKENQASRWNILRAIITI